MSVEQNLIAKDTNYFRQTDNKSKSLLGLFALGAVAVVGFVALNQSAPQQKSITNLQQADANDTCDAVDAKTWAQFLFDFNVFDANQDDALDLGEFTNAVHSEDPTVSNEAIAQVFGQEDLNQDQLLETGEVCTFVRISNALNAGNNYAPISDEDF